MPISSLVKIKKIKNGKNKLGNIFPHIYPPRYDQFLISKIDCHYHLTFFLYILFTQKCFLTRKFFIEIFYFNCWCFSKYLKGKIRCIVVYIVIIGCEKIEKVINLWIRQHENLVTCLLLFFSHLIFNSQNPM